MRDAYIKQMIKEGHMTDYEITSLFGIKKLLIMRIFFDNHKPVIVRKSKWESYWDVLDEAEAKMDQERK